PCDDEVIGISYDVYLEWLTLARCRSHACMDDIFQAIQRPIRKGNSEEDFLILARSPDSTHRVFR
ncbi:hypothetical protein, partial [Stutzerimonas stutzeri]|uniref:hypothetical protein n=1 Tax=Stutzerimonas stutzeri TaxID=316 RepID=UPI001CA5AB46